MTAAALIVGDGPLGQAVAARLATLERVALGTADPTRSGASLAELDRVRTLYGHTEPPGLAIARDTAALVRSARQLLPEGYSLVLVEPAADLDLDEVVDATAPGTTVVVVSRRTGPPTFGPTQRALSAGRTLWQVQVERVETWSGRRTAAEASAANVVRDLLARRSA